MWGTTTNLSTGYVESRQTKLEFVERPGNKHQEFLLPVEMTTGDILHGIEGILKSIITKFCFESPANF